MRARILNASAGSGKTYQLAYKYVRDVVEQPTLYRHILAVTFTNKATEEMKSRILKEIHRLASGGASPYLENLCRELSLDDLLTKLKAGLASVDVTVGEQDLSEAQRRLFQRTLLAGGE